MLLVNEDINDELFRRAAENYPLKTDSPDWDAVLNKMISGVAAAEPEPSLKKRNKFYPFLFLLLLLVPMVIFENKKSLLNEPVAGKYNGSGKPDIAKEGTGQPASTAALNDDAAKTMDDPSGSANTGTNGMGDPTPVNNDAQKINTPVVTTNTSDDNAVAAGVKHTYASKQRSRISIKAAEASADEEIIVRYPDAANKSKNKKINPNGVDEKNNTGKETVATITKEIPAEDNNETVKAEKQTAPLIVEAEKPTVDKDKSASTDPTLKKTTKEALKTTEKAVAKEDKKKKAHQKRFYAGLIAGPDFSAVKLQSVKKTGFGFGLLAGYKLTKKISIEAGIIKDKKYYSTDGKYFTKGSGMPVYAQIDYVNGGCNMWELPIKLNYTFISRARSSWFGSVGVSSYFMRSESYVYDLNYNGYIYPKSYDYYNKSTSLFAAVNISAGYSYKLGKIGSLRVEPYIKLPINKIGTGKLPIQSAGVYLGFTKDIF